MTQPAMLGTALPIVHGPPSAGKANMASRVFIVDDDAPVRKALERLIRAAGYIVDVRLAEELRIEFHAIVFLL